MKNSQSKSTKEVVNIHLTFFRYLFLICGMTVITVAFTAAIVGGVLSEGGCIVIGKILQCGFFG
ncbi:MAG: hypothetical protein KC736_04950 [Candidatus Moranbacteria bacterium]|nr:hypothetical protein [Candidatus Moranbacteria bacterium]